MCCQHGCGNGWDFEDACVMMQGRFAVDITAGERPLLGWVGKNALQADRMDFSNLNYCEKHTGHFVN